MSELTEKLKVALATVFSFYLKTHKYHWNLVDNDFAEYHKFLNKLYDDVWASVDDIAERIRTLGEYSPGSLEEFFNYTRIEGDTGNNPDLRQMLRNLHTDNLVVIEVLNEVFDKATEAKEQGVANFIADRIDRHKKWDWMLVASNPMSQPAG